MNKSSRKVQFVLATMIFVISYVADAQTQPHSGKVFDQVNEILNRQQQVLPKLTHYWILYPDVKSKIYRDYTPAGDNGQGYGNISEFKNRFGHASAAVGLAPNAYIELKESFLKSYHPKDGFTVSFWMYVDDETLSKDAQIFYAKNRNGMNLFGMKISGRKLSVNRYIDHDKEQVPWNLWFWDPVSFESASPGWYQVILVYKGNTHSYENKGSFMSVYLGKPDGTHVCAHNYFLPQDLSEAVKWGFGNPDGHTVKALSEFKEYDEAFTELQAKAAFDSERPITASCFRLINKASNKAAGVADHSKKDGAKVWQYQWEDQENQSWYIELKNLSDDWLAGEYVFINTNSGKTLEISRKEIFQNGAQAIQSAPTASSDNQVWRIQWTGIDEKGSYYRIRNIQSSKVLDVPDGSPANKRILQQWDWVDNDRQKWYIEEVDKNLTSLRQLPIYNIINKNSSKLMNLHGEGFMQDLSITQNNWVGETNQGWIVNYAGFDEDFNKPYYRILNQNTWKPLGIDFKGASPGDKIVQYVLCNNNLCDNVFWYIDYWGRDSLGPYYRIINKHSGLAAQTKGASKANGAILVQDGWAPDDDNQKWYIKKLQNFPTPFIKEDVASVIENWNDGLQMDGNNELITLQPFGTPWFFHYLGDGKYRIMNQKSKQVLQFLKQHGLEQGAWKDTENQKWYILTASKNRIIFLNCENLKALQPAELVNAIKFVNLEEFNNRILWRVDPYRSNKSK